MQSTKTVWVAPSPRFAPGGFSGKLGKLFIICITTVGKEPDQARRASVFQPEISRQIAVSVAVQIGKITAVPRFGSIWDLLRIGSFRSISPPAG